MKDARDASYAMTTGGPVAANSWGILLPHEHLLFDLTGFLTPPIDQHERKLVNGPLTLDNAAHLRRSPFGSAQNLRIQD
jgi:phosphotriesterase-related protein